MVLLKYLSNVWRTLEIPSSNFEISLPLKWSKNCFLVSGTAASQLLEIKITGAILYVFVVTLSTQNSTKTIETVRIRFQKNN